MVDSMASRTSKFKKGHRRAFSMPGGSHHLYTAVVENGSGKTSSVRKGFIVKYRPHADSINVEDALKTMLDSVNEFPFPNQMDGEDDDSEMMIKINEEEIVLSSDDLSKKDARIAIRRIWEARWKVTNFEFLPEWLQDNEFLRTGHRPPLPSFGSCFKSIFSLHTETGNIWTHMYGCVAFIGAAIWFMTRPTSLVQVEDKIVFSTFFIGAIACLGLSFAFHTVQCHSVGVGKLFSKLDYTGISLLIVGSFIPWIYYGFYCRMLPMIIYISMISLLGVAAVVVSLWDKFAQPRYRPLRALIFIAMGLSSIVPAFHILLTDGLSYLLNEASLQWLILMGVLYITGAVLYATRTPERCFPGKCDLWFQSHQIFHMFVICAAFVHFHGICETAVKRMEQGSCAEQIYEKYGV